MAPSQLEHALNAVERKWPVFPLAPLTKVPPASFHGRLDATLDEQQVHLWWGENPNYNIGIDTDGAGLVVIDIDVEKDPQPFDPDNPPEPFGFDAWDWLLEQTAVSEPRTYLVKTPSGGLHMYFKANPAMKIKTKAGQLAKGVDVRANNGSIVAAGSKTEKGTYECIRDIDPRPLPTWLRASLGKAGLVETEVEVKARPLPLPVRPGNNTNYAAAALVGELEKVRTCDGSGSRNETLNSAAYKLRRFVDAGELDGNETAQQLYNAAIEIGLTPHEATATIKSGLGV